MDTLSIPLRFNGPVASGNGGYSAGRLAAYLKGPAEITLRAPVPLDTPLEVRTTPDGAAAYDGSQLILEARNTRPPSAPKTYVPSLTEAKTAAATYRSAEAHALPTCFVCGPARAPGDGLCIFAAPVEGRQIVAAPWIPSEDLAGRDERIAPEFLWAALDCPGAFALDVEPIVLGRITAQILHQPGIDAPLIATGWALGGDGRKHRAGTALYTADGALLAHAEATWIQIDRHAHTPAKPR